jgi:purine-binding chemotaxis protein CheW
MAVNNLDLGPGTTVNLAAAGNPPARAVKTRTLRYGIVIKNRTGGPITGVRVEHDLPPGLRYVSSSPPARLLGATLVWDFGDVAAGARRALRVRARPTPGVAAAPPGRAAFRVFQCRHRSTAVTRPQLVVSLTAPAAAEAGGLIQTIEQILKVSNTGPAPAAGVRASVALPPGADFVLAAAAGRYEPLAHRVEWELGALAPGQARALALRLAPRRAGSLLSQARAWAENAAAALAVAHVRVAAPAERPADTPLPAARVLAGPAALPAVAPSAESERFIQFGLGELDLVVPVRRVLETGRPPAIIPMPNVPAWVLGVTNVHGDIVSVIDLHGFLGLEGSGRNPAERLLVVQAARGDLTIGLLVDRVKGLCALPAGQIRPAAGADPRLAPYTGGVAEVNGRRLILLDLDLLLSAPALRKFELV